MSKVALRWVARVIATVVASGCIAEPLDDPGDDTDGAQTTEDGAQATEDGAGAETSEGGSSTTDEPVGQTDGGPETPGTHHAACAEPIPDPPPAPPAINTTEDGTPAFAAWQEFACDDPALSAWPPCTQDSDCSKGSCLMLGGSAGVCAYADLDIWCDGEGEVVGTSDGSCWACVPLAAHASICCDDPDGHFDCRTWPYVDEPGVVGQPCALHDDCEPGLVCSANAGSGYGICACPETASMAIIPPQSCF